MRNITWFGRRFKNNFIDPFNWIFDVLDNPEWETSFWAKLDFG
jgi:hypothetical protein